MTESEIVGFIANQKTGIEKFLKGAKDELSNFFDDGVHNYLENQRFKYTQMKTFLFRNENVEFEKIFFPLKLGSLWFDKTSSKDAFGLMKSGGCITICGSAGSGKSMLLVDIFHRCIIEHYKIPIIIELRNLKYHEYSLNKYIDDVVLGQKIKPNSNIMNRTLERGQFVFLLDGYDEITSEYVDKVSYGIESFVDQFPKNQFVLTTRPGTNAERLKRFKNWAVQSLNDTQICSFVKQQVRLMEGTVSEQKILSDIFNKENAQFIHFLKNPLLLSMFIFVYRYNPELPKTKSKFYQNVIDTLFTKHDSITKGDSYLHDLKSKLSREEIEITLCWFSYASFFDEFFSFDEPYFNDLIKKIKTQLGFKFNDDDFLYDLKVNMSILVQDGLELKFPHRSLQEYFAAALISKQSDEIKQRIYSEKIAKIDGAEISNFLSLCYELDEKNIIDNLFIPVLSETQFAIKSSKEKPDVVKNFYEYLNLSSTLEANGSEFIELTSSMNGLRLQEEILEVFNMSIRYGDFYIAYSRPNVTNYLISKFSKAETNMISFHYHLDYDELEFVLEELELKSEVLKFYSNLTSLIDNLKLDSKRLDSIAQNLIGL